MSDNDSLQKVYSKFATKINPSIINEAIENAIPEDPLLLGDDDIKFLSQFDEKYWAQAMHQRNEKLMRYLVNLDKLRKRVYNKNIKNDIEEARAYFNLPKFNNLNKFVKDRNIKLQAEAAAKAKGTQMFPAGSEIKLNVLKHPIFSRLSDTEKNKYKNIINNINNYYLSKNDMQFSGLQSGNAKNDETIMANPFVAELAKQIEKGYGDSSGHDLHNPRMIPRSKTDNKAIERQQAQEEKERMAAIAAGKKPKKAKPVEISKTLEPKYVTDGFVFPSYTELDHAIREKIRAIRAGLSSPQDQADMDRMSSAELLNLISGPEAERAKGVRKLTADTGLHPTEKQLLASAEADIRAELQAQNDDRRIRGEPIIDTPANEIKKLAKARIRKDLKDRYMPDTFKDHLRNLGFSAKDVSAAEDPFGKSGLEFGSDMEKIIKQNAKSADEQKHPVMFNKVKKLINGKVQEFNLPMSLLNKSGFYKDVKLLYPSRSGEIELDDTQTNLDNPNDGLGPKHFDKELFERLVRKWRFLRENPSAREAPAVAAILRRNNLDQNSTAQQIIDASKRQFYQKANKSEYRSGTDVSSTWSHHPTRLSAKAAFFNKHHDADKFDKIMNVLLEKGVMENRNSSPEGLDEFINRRIDQKLASEGGDELPKLIMQRARSTIAALVQMRVFENIGNKAILQNYDIPPSSVSCFDDPLQTGCYGSGKFIGDVIAKEIKRIKDQNLFTGSVRKRGSVVDVGEDIGSLECKQGERAWEAGRCVYGADLRTINAYFQLGKKKVASATEEISSSGGEESLKDDLVTERKKIRMVLEGLNEMIKGLFVLIKAYNKAHHPSWTDAQTGAAAKTAITDFLKANIRLDNKEFMTALYGEYKNIWDQLGGIKGVKREDLDVPQIIRHSRENRPTTKQYFMKRFKSRETGKGNIESEQLQHALDSSNWQELDRIYKMVANTQPVLADSLYKQIMSNISVAAQEKFKTKNEATNSQILDKVKKANDYNFINSELLNRFFIDADKQDWKKKENHPSTMLSAFKEYVPFMRKRTLTDFVTYIGNHADWDPAKAFQKRQLPDDPVMRQQIIDKYRIWMQVFKFFQPYRSAVLKYLKEVSMDKNVLAKAIQNIDNPENYEILNRHIANLDKIKKKKK